MGTPFVRRVSDIILGEDKRQRVRARQALLVLLLDLLLTAIAWFGVWADLMASRYVLPWTVFHLGGATGFYLVIRAGFNLRFPADPALTLPQGLFSVLSMVAAYAICGPVRGAILLALGVTLVFGMFALTPRQVGGLSGAAVILLGLTMWFCHARAPASFPAGEEAMHFMLVAVILPSIAMLAGQLSNMRQKLREQRAALQQALEKNHELAIRDDLTGLYNRRHLPELMQHEVHRADRSGRSLCIALIDLDHFKLINDSHGHAQGDEVLRAFAVAARSALRDTDALGRWGGEEFMAMLPETGVDNAVRVIDRVRQRLAALRFDGLDPALRITFSAGIALCAAGETLAEAIARADQAMYAAKQAGRDRSVVAPAAAPGSKPRVEEIPAAPRFALQRLAVPSSTP